uniref:Syndecan n=1 Tax=Pelusios castaneus TaxID=367368 RepID=A0A8C8RTM0_9SAUR
MGPVSAAWWLFALCCQAACAQTTNLNLPPEDLDSSGDDDDAFSGSGIGPLIDHPMPVWNISEHTHSSSRSAMSTEATVHHPAVQGTEKSVEMISSPASDVVTDEAIVSLREGTHELGAAAEEPTTNEAVVTTRNPTTPSSISVTTARASTAVHLLESGSSAPGVSTEILDPNINTFREEDPAAGEPTIPPRDVDPTHEMEVLDPEGSGERDDLFFFPGEERRSPSEHAVADSTDAAEDTGTSEGLMGRKEVLGGVIAGGLVGLLFAVFLVGFMLYRMKKKDEGSYSLDEPKQSNGGYQKPQKQEEFYA